MYGLCEQRLTQKSPFKQLAIYRHHSVLGRASPDQACMLFDKTILRARGILEDGKHCLSA